MSLNQFKKIAVPDLDCKCSFPDLNYSLPDLDCSFPTPILMTDLNFLKKVVFLILVFLNENENGLYPYLEKLPQF